MPIFSSIGYTLMESFRKLIMDCKFINKRVRLFIHQKMCLERFEKEKILVRHNNLAKCLFNYFFKKNTETPREVFYKKAVLFNSEYCKILGAPILKNIWEQLLLKMCS